MESLSDTPAVRALYQEILDGWNQHSATAMAAPFTESGELIGFDGSQISGKAEIIAHLQPIFADHPTPPYTGIVRTVRLVSADVAILRANAGMVPPGKSDFESGLHAVQTLVAVKHSGEWRAELFQTTPAQFHGRPDLVQKLTEELRAARR